MSSSKNPNGSNALVMINKLLKQLVPEQTNNTLKDKFATQLTPLSNIRILSDRVVCVLGQNPGKMTLQGTNIYLVGNGKSRYMIDSGQGMPAAIPVLKQAMKDNNIESIQGIICTHWHGDHIKGIPSIRKEFGSNIPIYKHVSLFYDNKLDLTFDNIVDKQVFKCEGATLIAHYTPGHSDDHVVIELKEENAIFSGDCVLGEGSCTFKDLYLYLLSLKKLLTFNCEIMYPGHGPKVNNAQQKIIGYIKHRNNREIQIINALKYKQKELNNQYVASLVLVDIVYDKTPQNLKNMAHKNLKHHLHKLVMEGRVLVDDNGKYLFVQ